MFWFFYDDTFVTAMLMTARHLEYELCFNE